MSVFYGTNINNKNKTERNQKVKSGKCLFPFTYKWKTYTKCLETPKGPICATSLSEKTPKRRTLKTYGYCYKKHATKKAPKKSSKLLRINLKQKRLRKERRR